MADPVRQDTAAPFWTIEQAAKHFGISMRTMRSYIRGGLATHHDGLTVVPAEAISEYLKRRALKHAGRPGKN